MSNTPSETNDDIENVEAWAEVIRSLLTLVPCEKRAQILELASKNEEKERPEYGQFKILSSAEFLEGWENRPVHRHWHTIMRLKSLLIQVFARTISNNHHPKDAAAILLAQHRHGTGSGLLEDYLPDKVKGRTMVPNYRDLGGTCDGDPPLRPKTPQ